MRRLRKGRRCTTSARRSRRLSTCSSMRANYCGYGRRRTSLKTGTQVEVPILNERDAMGHVLRCKYEMITSHTARRSGVTNLYKEGVLDTREMMSISGHQSESVFEEYIKVSRSEQADKIAAKLRAKRKLSNSRVNADSEK